MNNYIIPESNEGKIAKFLVKRESYNPFLELIPELPKKILPQHKIRRLKLERFHFEKDFCKYMEENKMKFGGNINYFFDEFTEEIMKNMFRNKILKKINKRKIYCLKKINGKNKVIFSFIEILVHESAYIITKKTNNYRSVFLDFCFSTTESAKKLFRDELEELVNKCKKLNPSDLK